MYFMHCFYLHVLHHLTCPLISEHWLKWLSWLRRHHFSQSFDAFANRFTVFAVTTFKRKAFVALSPYLYCIIHIITSFAKAKLCDGVCLLDWSAAFAAFCGNIQLKHVETCFLLRCLNAAQPFSGSHLRSSRVKPSLLKRRKRTALEILHFWHP